MRLSETSATSRPTRFCDRNWRKVAKTRVGRVGVWRGDVRLSMSVSAPFVWRCLSGSAVAPFPHPAHRTGRADFPHPALGQDLTIGRIARLPGSPREGPEYAPKPPFHRRREIGFAAQTGHKEASAVGVIDSPPRRFVLAGSLGVAQIRGLVHSHLTKVGSRRRCSWVV